MSIELMTGVWKHGPQNIGERLVLLSLADQANDEGYCWPSFRSIAQRCAMSRRGVRGIVSRLEVNGWLRTEHRQRDDGTWASNGYWLNCERLLVGNGLPCDGEYGSLGVGNDVPHLGNDVPQGREHDSLGIGNDVPTMNPHIEPSSETSVNQGEGKPPLSAAQLAHVDLVNALGDVCGMSPKMNYGRLADAADVLQDSGYTADQVLQFYRRGDSWWYTDGHWLGREKGERPQPKHIIETIYGAVNHQPVAVGRKLSNAEAGLQATESLLAEFRGNHASSSKQLNSGLD